MCETVSRLKIRFIHADEEAEEEYCPIEQVRLTVPMTDDPTAAVLTFRTWFLGIASCVMLAFANQFFGYRQNQLAISAVAAQIVTLPVGKFMARVLPTTTFRVPMTTWSFSFNPGPFSLKEHVLITIFANCGAGGVYAVGIVNIVKVFYHRPLHPLAAWFLVQTTQVYTRLLFPIETVSSMVIPMLINLYDRSIRCLGMGGLEYSGKY